MDCSKRKFSVVKILFILNRQLVDGNGLPSRQSIANLTESLATSGLKFTQVVFNYQQPRIFVNARKSEQANWNHFQISEYVREDYDVTLRIVLSKAGARRLGKTRNTNVSRLKWA